MGGADSPHLTPQGPFYPRSDSSWKPEYLLCFCARSRRLLRPVCRPLRWPLLTCPSRAPRGSPKCWSRPSPLRLSKREGSLPPFFGRRLLAGGGRLAARSRGRGGRAWPWAHVAAAPAARGLPARRSGSCQHTASEAPREQTPSRPGPCKLWASHFPRKERDRSQLCWEGRSGCVLWGAARAAPPVSPPSLGSPSSSRTRNSPSPNRAP